jgi:hypothetical protein
MMEVCIKEIGNTILFKVMVNYFILLVEWHMMENGIIHTFMVKENYIIKIQYILKE